MPHHFTSNQVARITLAKQTGCDDLPTGRASNKTKIKVRFMLILWAHPLPRLWDKIVSEGDIPAMDWLSKEALTFYVKEFEKSGFRGPLNWYRNIDFNWENTGFLSSSKLQQSTLFIAGDVDPVLQMYPGAYESLEERVPNLWKKVLLPNIGHWVQQEAAEDVNMLLLEFLEGQDIYVELP